MKKRTVAFIIFCIGIQIALSISLSLSGVELAISRGILCITGHFVAYAMFIGIAMFESKKKENKK